MCEGLALDTLLHVLIFFILVGFGFVLVVFSRWLSLYHDYMMFGFFYGASLKVFYRPCMYLGTCILFCIF